MIESIQAVISKLSLILDESRMFGLFGRNDICLNIFLEVSNPQENLRSAHRYLSRNQGEVI